MKNKKLVFLTIVYLLVGTFVVSLADSGWDYSYDSGSDWDSGGWSSSNSGWSSYDYDYDYSHGSGVAISPIGMGIYLVFMAIIIYAIVAADHRVRRGRVKRYQKEQKEIDDKYKERLSLYPEFKEDEFLNKAFEIYKNIQEAWSNFDYDTLCKLTTNELYNTYKMQLETLALKNQKNIMSNFVKQYISIKDVQEVNGILTIKVVLKVYQKDYVINTLNGKVVRGNAIKTCGVLYELTFVNNKKVEEFLTVCPNCGAKVENVVSQKCEYCNSDLVGNSVDNWVLAKKQVLYQ